MYPFKYTPLVNAQSAASPIFQSIKNKALELDWHLWLRIHDFLTNINILFMKKSGSKIRFSKIELRSGSARPDRAGIGMSNASLIGMEIRGLSPVGIDFPVTSGYNIVS